MCLLVYERSYDLVEMLYKADLSGFLTLFHLRKMSNRRESDQKTGLLSGHHSPHYSSTANDSKPPVSRPKYKRRRSSFDASTYNSTGQSPGYVKSSASSVQEPLATSDAGLTVLQILGLTICMAGVQFTCKSFTLKTTREAAPVL